MKSKHKLRALWTKKDGGDLLTNFPLGSQTKADGGYLVHALGPILDELERRGYARESVRFSVEPQPGNQRFASQRPPPDEDGDPT